MDVTPGEVSHDLSSYNPQIASETFESFCFMTLVNEQHIRFSSLYFVNPILKYIVMARMGFSLFSGDDLARTLPRFRYLLF